MYVSSEHIETTVLIFGCSQLRPIVLTNYVLLVLVFQFLLMHATENVRVS